MLDGKQVLIVEDDAVTAIVLQGMLLKLGAAAVVRQGAGSAWQALCAQRFDLVFVDLCLGTGEGEALLRRLRAGTEADPPAPAPDARTPVVAITGRHDLDARVRLLDAGADQFVHMPFDLRELQELVHAVFRRRALAGPQQFALDPVQRACHYRGRLVALTRAEFDILLCLARSWPQTVPAGGLLKDAGEGAPPGLTALHVDIHHLRQKLDVGTIETVRDVGYRLTDAQLADSDAPRRLGA
ncbi:MAG TPA: response regulator transcription factor [Ramlibacter sp.]|uniref:response regulator transcription factor n=1 Tax=Ramlibacter sp. TaxID=1917967 RepID=UPI002D7E2A64|nr:response regulator transcription factor [Ramlibacter sp.]HET8746074.1 response regulator transcription factor [Ramlibacter sp.]